MDGRNEFQFCIHICKSYMRKLLDQEDHFKFRKYRQMNKAGKYRTELFHPIDTTLMNLLELKRTRLMCHFFS